MGGLTKEWFLLLVRQIFHTDYGEINLPEGGRPQRPGSCLHEANCVRKTEKQSVWSLEGKFHLMQSQWKVKCLFIENKRKEITFLLVKDGKVQFLLDGGLSWTCAVSETAAGLREKWTVLVFRNSFLSIYDF